MTDETESVRTESATTDNAAQTVRTVSPASGNAGQTVRTREPHPLAHSKRFELRVQPRQIAAWQQMADAQGVSVADMVREAMEYAAANMPTGYVKAKREAEQAALVAAFSAAVDALNGKKAP